jgi:putative DNA primase/helicase
MNAETVARALGGRCRSGRWWRCRCPVHQGKSESLSLRDGDSRLILKCWAGCTARDVLNELARLGLLAGQSWPTPVDGDEPYRERDRLDRARRIANAKDLFFNKSRPAAGTVVERYLVSRGIEIAPPDTIRASARWLFHSESGERRLAMLGLVEHVEYGAVGVHITYLAADGSGKATIDPAKRLVGVIKGGAVRLGPVVANEWLIVGEGIETTASAMQLWGLPSGWAALSANGLRRLILPPEPQQIVIAVDNDVNGVGQAAARDAAWQWTEAGRTVRIALPPRSGADFNDILMGEY